MVKGVQYLTSVIDTMQRQIRLCRVILLKHHIRTESVRNIGNILKAKLNVRGNEICLEEKQNGFITAIARVLKSVNVQTVRLLMVAWTHHTALIAVGK